MLPINDKAIVVGDTPYEAADLLARYEESPLRNRMRLGGSFLLDDVQSMRQIC